MTETLNVEILCPLIRISEQTFHPFLFLHFPYRFSFRPRSNFSTHLLLLRFLSRHARLPILPSQLEPSIFRLLKFFPSLSIPC